MPAAELERLREEFWATNGSGAYGGQPGASRPRSASPWAAARACWGRLCSPPRAGSARLAVGAHTGADAGTRRTVIWAALRAAASADIDTARLIVDAAGIVVPGRDLSATYDERGALYELPPFVLSAPTNLVR